MMYFPPISDFPLFSEYFIHPQKFLVTYLVIDSEFFNFLPIFAKSYISPYFGKNYYCPPFIDFLLHFVQFTCLLPTFRAFRFPYSLTMMHLCIIQCTYWTPLVTVKPYFAQT